MATPPKNPANFKANNLLDESPTGLMSTDTAAGDPETAEAADDSEVVHLDLLPDLDEVYSDTIIRIVAINGRNQSPVRITPFQTKNGKLLTGQEDIPFEEKKKRYVKIIDEMTNFTFQDNIVLDLTNQFDKITWGWIQYFPFLAKTAEDVNEETLFFVENKKAFIRKKITMRQKRDKATDLVRQADMSELIDLALLLGEK